MKKLYRNLRFWSFLVIFGLLCIVAPKASASDVTNSTLIPGLNTFHAWAFTNGTSSTWGGSIGEYEITFEGNTTTSYTFGYPSWSSLASGTQGSLLSVENAYKAAWLMDQYAPGLGNGSQPGYTDTEARTALAFAIFEIGTEAPGNPYSIGSGSFYIWNGPLGARTLAEAYLTSLAAASPDQDYLESRYDIITDEQYVGSGYNKMIIPTTVVPEPVSTTLFIVGGVTLGIRRFWKKRSL